jgi:hypothetical protein
MAFGAFGLNPRGSQVTLADLVPVVRNAPHGSHKFVIVGALEVPQHPSRNAQNGLGDGDGGNSGRLFGIDVA